MNHGIRHLRTRRENLDQKPSRFPFENRQEAMRLIDITLIHMDRGG